MIMRDKYGDYMKIYTTESKQFVFIDMSYEDSPEKLQSRVILDEGKTRELITKLEMALTQLNSTNC